MKKILSVVLALCLVLALGVTAFAASDSPKPDDKPSYTPTPTPSTVGSSVTSKYTYSATTASGLPVNASVDNIASGSVYDEIKAAGVVGLYYISINSGVADTELVNVDVYAPGATKDSVVIVRDAWEVLPGVTVTVNGNRATISAPAGILNQWHYVAIVNSWDVVDVKNPQQGTENKEDSEYVDDNDTTPEVDVKDTVDTTPAPVEQAPAAEEKNPGTGVALAVVPMLVSAAAAVISKRR